MNKELLNNSIVKAITIINCFSNEKPRLRLKDISSLTGINQPTAYRLLTTMKEFNLIEQNDSIYSLGRAFLKYQGIVINSMTIRQVCLPFIEELSTNLKVNVNLAVLDENEVVYVARAETPYCMYGYFHIGMRRPIYCTALGKVLISRQPEKVQDIFKRGVRRYTLNTITSAAEYDKELENVRLQGYALDLEEWANGVNCIAVPVYGPTEEIVAGISISGPTSHHSVEELKEMIPFLLECANRLSTRLGSSNGTF